MVKGEGMDEYVHVFKGIDGLPPKKDGIRLIVPLFTLDAVERMSREPGCPEIYKGRDDLRAPGKKVFGTGGKLLYAEGLKIGTATEL
jgi:hypothetical protein